MYKASFVNQYAIDEKLILPVEFDNLIYDGENLFYEAKDLVGSYSFMPQIVPTYLYAYGGKGYNNLTSFIYEIINDMDYDVKYDGSIVNYISGEKVDSMEDLSEDDLEYLRENAYNTSYLSYIYHANKNTRWTFYPPELEEELFYSSGSKYSNTYFAIYSVTYEHPYSGTCKVYFPVCYVDLVKTSDGKIMYSQNQGIIGTSSFPRSDGFVRGYADLDKMYKNLEFEYGS